MHRSSEIGDQLGPETHPHRVAGGLDQVGSENQAKCVEAAPIPRSATIVPLKTRPRLSPPASTHDVLLPIQDVSKPDPIRDDHSLDESHSTIVIASEIDHPHDENPMASVDLAPIIGEIREQWRRRQIWHRSEKSLTLQAMGLCRRLVDGDKAEGATLYDAAMGKGDHALAHIALGAIFPLTEARSGVERHRKLVEKRLAKLAKELPVAPFVIGVRGVGLASLAAIVGEAGDLANYSNPAKLWKRLGLAVMPDGTRQRKVAGDAAIEHGYSPARRSVVWNVGACIVKAGGPLKAVYDERKVYELTRVETKGHAHNRAQRYVEKRFVRDLWAAWKRAGGDQ